jgi:dihydroorotate dehydrogenase (NAD+) catalytic subunit
MIDLAPNHKTELTLRNPLMTAAGCYGLGGQYGALVDPDPLGAVVVGPVTADARTGADPPRLLPFSGGALLSTGLANPGVGRVIRDSRRAWARLPVPVIVHVAGTSPQAVRRCCSRISAIEEVAAVELGIPDSSAGDYAIDLASAARESCVLPLIVRVPLTGADTIVEGIEDLGADAVCVGNPPRGILYSTTACRYVAGDLYGAFVLPLVLEALVSIRGCVGLPIIGSGGVWDVDDARALLQAGCVAVQADAAVWHDPASLARIARSLEV